MKLKICIFLLLISNLVFSKSKPDTTYFDSIRNIEYQLEGLSNNIINGEDQQTRVTSTYYFIQTFKQALKIPGSFFYPFNLLKTVSNITSKDQKFRIYTWNLLLDSAKYLYFGAIHMNLNDTFILHGLYDSSRFIKNTSYSVLDNRHWIGALYYQMHEYTYKKKNYYILMGWDGEDMKLNRKILDVLTFDENNNPKFGAAIFDNNGDIQNRMIWTFSEQASMLLRYEQKEKIIVFANCVPPNDIQKGAFQYYLPDGSYDFFKFKKGIWIRNEYLFKSSKDPFLFKKE